MFSGVPPKKNGIGSEGAEAPVCPQNRAYGSVHGSSHKAYPLTQLKPVRELLVGANDLPQFPNEPADRVCPRHREGIRERPVSPVGEGRSCRLTAWHTALNQFSEEIALALLLLHEAGSQSSPDMGFDLLELGRVVGHRKVVRPAYLPAVNPLHARLCCQVGASGRQLLDFGHGRLQGLAGDREGLPDNGHPQKLDPIRARHLTLLLVYHQFQALLDVAADASHHSLSRAGRLHEDVAIIGEPAEVQAAPLQFLVEFVKDDVTEQGTQGAALNGSFRRGGHEAVGHDATAEDQSDQSQDALVGNRLTHPGDQPIVVDAIEKF